VKQPDRCERRWINVAPCDAMGGMGVIAGNVR